VRAASWLSLSAAIWLLALNGASGQELSFGRGKGTAQNGTFAAHVCGDSVLLPALKDALRQVCLRLQTEPPVAIREAVVVGFVGGFVRRDDPKHPEVQFADYLRERYGSNIKVEVFSNHEGKKALAYVLSQLGGNRDGMPAAGEGHPVSIIIYGHSWGASQAITLARKLERRRIPVRLTIQVDSIRKLGQNDSRIPANVESAVNFYQSGGPIHGRPLIFAVDPAHTEILGNFRMTYRDHRPDCSNYPWFVRLVNRPHHEIENDSRVWDQMAFFIESVLSRSDGTQITSLSH